MISKVRPAVFFFFPGSELTSTAGAGRAMAPAASPTSLCLLRARLDSVWNHLSSRCGNLFWWNAEVSEALLDGNSSLTWLCVGECEADALLPRTLAAAAEQEIVLALVISIRTWCGTQRWGSHLCFMNMDTYWGETLKLCEHFNLQDFCSVCSLALPWAEVHLMWKKFFIYTSQSYCFDKHGCSHKSKHLQKHSLLAKGWCYKCSVSLTWPFMPL